MTRFGPAHPSPHTEKDRRLRSSLSLRPVFLVTFLIALRFHRRDRAVYAADTARRQGNGVAMIAVDSGEDDGKLFVAERFGKKDYLLPGLAKGRCNVVLPAFDLTKVRLIRRGRGGRFLKG